MKKLFLFLTAALLIAATSQAQQKIAVLDFKAGVGVAQGDVDGISAIFGTYFIDPAKFTLVERSQIDRVISEQGFQQTSLTQQQMVRVGQILNLSKMVVGDVNVMGGQYNVDVRVVDVQSGAVNATDGATWAQGSSYRELMSGLAGRLKTKMFPATSGTPASSVQLPSMPTSVVTLLGYLHIYPGELGEFPSVPSTVIAQLNQQGMHGYNDWRLPTVEELALMKANAGQVGLGAGNYMTSDGTRSGVVRLVTTGLSTAEQQRKAKEGVLINGVTWANRNVGSRGTFVSDPEQYGNFYTFEEAQTACPEGWRTPTKSEFESLAAVGSTWTTVNGVAGCKFGSGGNAIFLPAAGYRNYSNGSVSTQGASGLYWSSTANSGTTGYFLFFYSSFVYPSYGSNYAYGFSVRCVRP